jgi:hypothetical protein
MSTVAVDFVASEEGGKHAALQRPSQVRAERMAAEQVSGLETPLRLIVKHDQGGIISG